MRRHRVLFSAALAGAALLATSGCSTVEPAAATVNGEEIDRADFEEELDLYRDNDAWIQLSLMQQMPMLGAGGSAVSVDFARSRLQELIFFRLVDQEVRARGLTVQDDARELARTLAPAGYLNPATQQNVLDEFPAAFRDARVEELAALLTLAVDAADHNSLTEAHQAAYDTDPDRYATRCVSHILSDDEAGSQEVLDELARGRDFGDVAVELSTDPSATTNRGEIGCFGIEDANLDVDFLDGAFAAEVGEPSDPVPTQFGSHVILVTSAAPRSLEEARDVVQGQVLGELNDALGDVVDRMQDEADVGVDPRYGRWDEELHVILDGEAGVR